MKRFAEKRKTFLTENLTDSNSDSDSGIANIKI